MSENVLDAENWKLEAQAVIKDIENHVKLIELSSRLQSTNEKIFLNLTTIEGKNYLLELSGKGFRIVGDQFDTINCDTDEYFETPYSLLNKISNAFHQSFGNELMKKLASLN